MKKYFLIISLLLLASFVTTPYYAEAKTTKTKTTATKKVAAKKVVIKKAPLASVKWTSGALKKLNHVPSFARAKVKAKMNDYARQHKIKIITPKIYDEIHV